MRDQLPRPAIAGLTTLVPVLLFCHHVVAKPGVHQTRAGPVVREPAVRVLSLYHHAKRAAHKPRLYRMINEGGLSLRDFVTSIGYTQAENGQTRRLAGLEPPFGECTPEMLERAKRNLREEFAAVGVLERLEESLRVISETLGWDRCDHSAFESRNVNPARPRLTEIPAEVRRLIERQNELDNELYNYACRLLDRAIGHASGGPRPWLTIDGVEA